MPPNPLRIPPTFSPDFLPDIPPCIQWGIHLDIHSGASPTAPPRRATRFALSLSCCVLPLALLCLLIARPAHAAPVPVETSTLDTLPGDSQGSGLGLTVSVAQRPFVGVDNQVTVLPYFRYHAGPVYVEGLNLGAKLVTRPGFRLELLATPRFFEVQPSFADNGELDGVDKTHPTYFAGLSAQFHTAPATFTVQLLRDVLESDGGEAVATVSRSFTLSPRLTLAPALGLTYQSAALVDHFYGVQTHEVRPGRPAYSGRATLNAHIGLTAIWDTGGRLQWLGQLRYEALGNGITDSPLVDRDTILTGVVGAVYRF